MEKLYEMIIATEQNELVLTETYEEKNNSYFTLIDNIRISLQDLYDEFINVNIKVRDDYIPLPSVLCHIISSYTEGYIFCPLIKHFNYCNKRLKYINYYNHYIRQPNLCQYYIDIAREAKEIIKDIKNEIYTNKKIIENSIPFLSTTRLLRVYKNRIIMSKYNISRCVMTYLDIENMTDKYEVYYSQVREYKYARQYAKKREVLY